MHTLAALDNNDEVKLKKFIIFAVAAFAISACKTTPDDIRSKEPAQVYSSQKAAQEVSTCIVNKWTKWTGKFDDWGIIKSTETAQGYSVSAHKYGTDPEPVSTNYLADIENTDAGSETKLYQHLSINFGSNPFFDAVDECQNQ